MANLPIDSKNWGSHPSFLGDKNGKFPVKMDDYGYGRGAHDNRDTQEWQPCTEGHLCSPYRPATNNGDAMAMTPGKPIEPIPEQSASGAHDCRVSIRQINTYHKIKQILERYVSYFRSIQLKMLLNVGYNNEANVPTLPEYESNGRNGMCYAHILGKWQDKMCSKAPNGNAPVEDITEVFAYNLSSLLATRVEKQLAMEPPTTQYQFLTGHSSKQFK